MIIRIAVPVVFVLCSLVTSELKAQKSALDTCACKTLLQAFDIYMKDGAQLGLSYDSVVQWMLGYPCPVCENAMNVCFRAAGAGADYNRQMETDENTTGISVWNEVAYSVLNQLATEPYFSVPESITCGEQSHTPDLADAYTLRLWFIYQFKESPMLRKLSLKGSVYQKLLQLYTMDERKLNKHRQVIYSALEAELRNFFSAQSQISLKTAAGRALLSYYMQRPDCLKGKTANLMKMASYELTGDSFSGADATFQASYQLLKSRDTARITEIREQLRLFAGECRQGYHLPLAWYLFDKEEEPAQQNRSKKQKFSDSAFCTQFIRLLNVTARKPDNDWLFTKSFYLYPTAVRIDKNLGRELGDLSALWPMATIADLKWQLLYTKGEDPFAKGMKVKISDTRGHGLSFNLLLPVSRTRWSWPYMIKAENPVLITHKKNKILMALDVVFLLRIDSTHAEWPETACELNYGDNMLLFGAMDMVDIVTVLVEAQIR